MPPKGRDDISQHLPGAEPEDEQYQHPRIAQRGSPNPVATGKTDGAVDDKRRAEQGGRSEPEQEGSPIRWWWQRSRDLGRLPFVIVELAAGALKPLVERSGDLG